MFKAPCSRQSSFYGCILLVCTLTQHRDGQIAGRCSSAGELRKCSNIFRS